MRKMAAISLALLLAVGVAQSQQTPKVVSTPIEKQQIQQSNKAADRTSQVKSAAQQATSTTAVVSNAMQPIGNGQSSSQQSDKDEGWWHKFLTDPVATFTGLLTLVTFFLWLATRDLVKGAEATAERQLRAYLHVKSAHGSFDKNDVFWAKIIVQNAGQTPAYDVVEWVGIVGALSSQVPNIQRPSDTLKKARSILGPQHHMEVMIEFAGGSMCAHNKEKLIQGDANIYVWGEISYRDVFDRNHITHYKYWLGGEGAAEGRFRATEDGNDAT